MSNVINKPLCATQFGNVGFGDCFIEIAKMAGAIQVTSGFAISEANVVGLQAFLKNLITATIGTRIFPYHNFISIADASEDLNITTTDYGAKYINREGFYDWTFRYLKGGLQLHQEIKKNEGAGKYFLFYDDNGVLYGYTTGGQLKGIPVDIFHAKPWKVPTGADQAAFDLRFIINPKYLNSGNLGYIPTSQLGFNLFDIAGLQDVSLQLINLVSNVATIGAFSKISNVNMHDAYAANLARTAAWTARNNFNNPVTISSVTDNVAASGWDFTFLSGNWLASDKVFLKGVNASVWAATPILVVGFEAKDELQIEAPAS